MSGRSATIIPLVRAGEEPPVLTSAEFETIVEFIYRKTGMRFTETKRSYVDKRVVERMHATGAERFRDYFMLLRFAPTKGELQRLIDAMTVNETYFLRESYQLDCLVREVLPEIVAERRPGHPIRIWSIPCSTGEEPYSIAITLLDSWADVDSHEVQITGGDIDSSVLERARDGIYGARAFQKMPEQVRNRYFSRVDNENWRIIPEIRRSIDFVGINVTDPQGMQQVRDADVIFCRNMLIYFDEASQRRAVQALYESLAPGGFFFMGHSESMSRMSSSFRPRRFHDAIVYQRPTEGRRR